MDYVNQIKERIQLSEIVRERVKLERKGRNFLGFCPFHNEKTPSFTVNDDKRFYHCFGCGAHGDIFDFVMKFEGLTFTEVTSNLAEKAGITIEVRQRKKNYRYEILELATEWFKKNLSENKQVVNYVKSRYIKGEAVRLFGIGYAPVTGVKNYLQSKGFTKTQIAESGLISKNYKEYFYNRIIFPIRNSNGQVVAFGGRTINNTHPKYLNSPESSVFNKSETLYGFNLAKKESLESIIIVEGYFDVIALYQSGIKNVAAPLGTALTYLHLRKLAELYKEIIICFDGDSAGRNAVLKVIKLFFSMEYFPKASFIFLPPGKDPCDSITKNGIDFFHSLLKERKTISETLWEVLSEQFELSIPEEKVKLKNQLFKYIGLIEDKNSSNYYRNFFIKKLNSANKKKSKPYDLLFSINSGAGEVLIKIVLLYPELLNNSIAEEQFAKFKMETLVLSDIQSLIVSFINQGNSSDLADYCSRNSLSNEIKRIMNNQYALSTKEQAFVLWKRIMITEEIKSLEEEYKNEITESLNMNKSHNKAEEILTRLLELKQLLENY
ncbi:MAG: DNA primase [Rickettsiaceae bacterium H1]|nr:DNA primase [Rickettsiaceae bacterium H1]